ncbi:AtpZ/AtpI family protein [Chondrinema litorale]|uniref:AtpZ/AtpI family protein n=1 Tax=Chondrinema litorale TaxID=2994555 RepID=UPI003D6EF0B4
MSKNNQPKRQSNKPFGEYIKYSSLAMEMIGAILLGAWIGSLLDDYFQTSRAYFTLVMMLLGVGTSISLLIKKLNNNK